MCYVQRESYGRDKNGGAYLSQVATEAVWSMGQEACFSKWEQYALQTDNSSLLQSMQWWDNVRMGETSRQCSFKRI